MLCRPCLKQSNASKAHCHCNNHVTRQAFSLMLHIADYSYIISDAQFQFRVLVAYPILSHVVNRLTGLQYLLPKNQRLDDQWSRLCARVRATSCAECASTTAISAVTALILSSVSASCIKPVRYDSTSHFALKMNGAMT